MAADHPVWCIYPQHGALNNPTRAQLVDLANPAAHTCTVCGGGSAIDNAVNDPNPPALVVSLAARGVTSIGFGLEGVG